MVFDRTIFIKSKLQCFILDLPGHGNSEGKSLSSIEKISDWIEKVFNQLNIFEVTIIGHSQGCLEALEYNFRYPKKIKNLIFVGGSYKMPVNQDLLDLAEAGDDHAVKLMMKWGYESSKKFIGGNPVEKIINSPRDIREILAIDLKACNDYKNGLEAIKSINCPTLLIFGELDKMLNIEKGEITYTLKGHADAVTSLYVNQDNSALYSAGNDGTIRMWK